jgi:hypothetical protein
LPPGRARLATRPSFTGSSGMPNTTGMVVFSAFAAIAPAVPPDHIALGASTCTIRVATAM